MKILPPLACLALVASLHAQPPEPPAGPRNLSVCYETFSVPLALAAKLQREDKTDAELYAFLAAASEKDGVRQESFDVLRSRSGEKSVAECISEQIYPTEFEPASTPGTLGVAITPPPVKDTPTPAPDTGKLKDAPPLRSLDGLQAPVSPTAYETRNTGRTLEVASSVGDDAKNPSIHLRINPEHVTDVSRRTWGQGMSKTEIATFETQRVTTAIIARSDQPVLLGTPSRPPVSEVDAESAQRVWFAFVTATIIEP